MLNNQTINQIHRTNESLMIILNIQFKCVLNKPLKPKSNVIRNKDEDYPVVIASSKSVKTTKKLPNHYQLKLENQESEQLRTALGA